MSIEIGMLLASTLLYFITIMIPAYINLKVNGVDLQAGPRDNLPEPSAFVKRAKRLADNMQENLLLFAILVLVAAERGASGTAVEWGAILFFAARVAHAAIYLAGSPRVRPLFWLLGVIGMGMIAYGILTHESLLKF